MTVEEYNKLTPAQQKFVAFHELEHAWLFPEAPLGELQEHLLQQRVKNYKAQRALMAMADAFELSYWGSINRTPAIAPFNPPKFSASIYDWQLTEDKGK